MDFKTIIDTAVGISTFTKNVGDTCRTGQLMEQDAQNQALLLQKADDDKKLSVAQRKTEGTRQAGNVQYARNMEAGAKLKEEALELYKKAKTKYEKYEALAEKENDPAKAAEYEKKADKYYQRMCNLLGKTTKDEED